MISISKKNVSIITKLGLIILILYVLVFSFFKISAYYKTYFEKQRIQQDMQIKKNEANRLKRLTKLNKEKIEKINNSYIKKEQLDSKIKDIFKRMSIFDYQLKYIDSKKLCVDRYVLITQLTANSEDGLKAGKSILSYLGKIQKSEKNETIYFVDYIATAKEKKVSVKEETK